MCLAKAAWVGQNGSSTNVQTLERQFFLPWKHYMFNKTAYWGYQGL